MGAKPCMNTDQGKDLLPVVVSIIGWAQKYDPQTNVSSELVERLRTDLTAVRCHRRRPSSRPVARRASPSPKPHRALPLFGHQHTGTHQRASDARNDCRQQGLKFLWA
jgi:hypothetical protein